MNLRERIADWISGGALTRLAQAEHDRWDEATVAEAQAREATARAYATQVDLQKWQRESNEGWSTATTRLLALQSIAAQEKPTSNATVKRMARIAREALE